MAPNPEVRARILIQDKRYAAALEALKGFPYLGEREDIVLEVMHDLTICLNAYEPPKKSPEKKMKFPGLLTFGRLKEDEVEEAERRLKIYAEKGEWGIEGFGCW